MTQLLVLGLPPHISHAKLPTSPVNLDTHIPLLHQPKETSHRYTTRFGLAIHHIANKVNNERYKHHIAALVTPPEACKQPSLEKLLKGPDKDLWDKSNTNEWGRLLPNGVGKSRTDNQKIKGAETIKFIKKSQVPDGRRFTYVNHVCTI